MPSTAIDSQIHGCMFSTDEMRKTLVMTKPGFKNGLTPKPLLQRLKANSELSQKDKADIIQKYAKAELLDIPSIGEFYKSSITIVPLLKAFKKVLPDNAGEFVHWGATSQDIVDTGIVLLEKDAYEIILRDMKLCQEYCLDLAKSTATPLCPAELTSYTLFRLLSATKPQSGVDELGRDIERLEQIQDRVFVGNCGNGWGRWDSSFPAPEHGLAVQKRMMEILGLNVPTIAWHVARDNQAEFVSVLALCAGTLGRIIHEILTLQRTEILELEEPFFMGAKSVPLRCPTNAILPFLKTF